MKDKRTRAAYRSIRVRERLSFASPDRPRLSVRRSLRYLYAQVVDPSGRILAAASSLSKEFKDIRPGKNLEAARRVGELVAKKAVGAGVKSVAFDRGSCRFHGRVKALAEAARSGGLEF